MIAACSILIPPKLSFEICSLILPSQVSLSAGSERTGISAGGAEEGDQSHPVFPDGNDP